jgi:hypothetical protein
LTATQWLAIPQDLVKFLFDLDITMAYFLLSPNHSATFGTNFRTEYKSLNSDNKYLAELVIIIILYSNTAASSIISTRD